MSQFRLDIQGLRAIAIIFVILFHTKLEIFSGGYIGVDIFFVISGYLITKIIFKDLDKKRFSLTNFYLRRMRRILPALFFTFIFVLFGAFFFTLDSGFKFIGQSLISSIFFFSNFFFWYKNIDYYGLDGEFNPLTHTWSLSFEEQFYLFFPILLILFSKRVIFKIILIISFLSILFAQLGGNIKLSYPFFEENLYFFNPSHFGTFFSPIGRIWELLMGASTYFIQTSYDLKKNDNISLISFILLISCFFLLNENVQVPSILIFPSVLATCLIILFNNDKSENLVNIFLHSKFFSFYGNISYSLYLIHFPIFVFYRYIFFNDINIVDNLICICFSTLIAFFMWKYIEQPFRDNKKIKNQLFLIITISLVVIFSILGSLIYTNKINSYKFKQLYKIYPNIYGNLNDIYLKEIHEFDKKVTNIKKFSNNLKSEKILIIGNSFAKNLFLALEQNKNHFPNKEFVLYKLKLFKLSEFYKDDNEFKDFFKSDLYDQADTIIISNRYINVHQTMTGRDDIAAIKYLYSKTNTQNKKLIITGNSAIFFGAGDNSLKFIINTYKKKFIKDNQYLFNPEIKMKKFKLLNLDKYGEFRIKKLANDLNLKYLNKLEYVCNREQKVCETVTPQGEIIYFDYSHTTLAGAKFLGKKIVNTNWLEY